MSKRIEVRLEGVVKGTVYGGRYNVKVVCVCGG